MPVLTYDPGSGSIRVDDKYVPSATAFCYDPELRNLIFSQVVYRDGDRYVLCDLCKEMVLLESAPEHLEDHLDYGDTIIV